MLTRRRLLKGAASVTAAAAAQALMPLNVRRVLAQGAPKQGSLTDIKHVVVLMQENRSFDHYFGTMAGVRGIDDPHALKFSNGRSVFYQPDAENPDGYLLPFHLDTRSSSAQKIPSTSHAWAVQHEAWNRRPDGSVATSASQGRWRKWPLRDGILQAGRYSVSVRPGGIVHVCDAYHCSVFGPTWPNRMYLMTGMIDPDATGGGPILNNWAPPGGYTWTTYPERLRGSRSELESLPAA